MQTDSRRPDSGAAVAELALVVPIMMALLLVVFDFGRGMNAYISVSNGARDAARVAMQEDKDCTVSDLGTVARNGASPYDVTVSVTDTGDTCIVSVGHIYTPVVPFVTESFALPTLGTVGPLWDGTMSETMVSR